MYGALGSLLGLVRPGPVLQAPSLAWAIPRSVGHTAIAFRNTHQLQQVRQMRRLPR